MKETTEIKRMSTREKQAIKMRKIFFFFFPKGCIM
jgi:hypothetical protein